MRDPKIMTYEELDKEVAQAIGLLFPEPHWSPSRNLHDCQKAVMQFIKTGKGKQVQDEIWGQYHAEEPARRVAETIVWAHRTHTEN